MNDKWTISYEPPNPKAYIDLRIAGGLSSKSLEGATVGLKNGLFTVSIYEDTELIGLGRVIGDGGTTLHVVDVVVKPSHQGQGLGKRIMKEITQYLDDNAYPGTYVSLIADAPADHLYKQFGFEYTYPNSYGMYKRY